MGKRKIIWNILPYYVLIIFLSLISVSWYASKAVKDFHRKDVSRSLEERARIIEVHLSDSFKEMEPAYVDSICDEYGRFSEMRITVIAPNGKVIGDSEKDPAEMENHKDRPEIKKALGGSPGISERYSTTFKQNFIYVAVPLISGGRLSGIVRASIPLTNVEGSLSLMYRRLFIAGIIVAFIAGLLSLAASRRISNPLENMKKGVEHFYLEDLEYRIPVQGFTEIGELARAINGMASKLRDRINTVEGQKSEQEAVFAAIPEGILVVDSGERIVRMNPGASDLLGISISDGIGRLIHEVVRNNHLLEFVEKSLSSSTPIETDLTLMSGTDNIFLQARGVALLELDGKGGGAVIVLSNVTRLKKLESLRREFVDNVSHELRTPVTAVKGFVETLKDGAIESKADTEKFLGIIDRQADRMNSIISDLLMLARVEGGDEKGKIRFENARIMDILAGARQVCLSKAEDKNVTIEIDCAEDLDFNVSPDLLEQSVINLVDNAIKYSSENSKVTVKAYLDEDQGYAGTKSEKSENISVSSKGSKSGVCLSIEVIDRGCGIEHEFVPRLFERFYRIDKARSRKLGGTGLGLAIVKHIAKVHHGEASVKSEVGKGSVFHIRIPALQRD